MISEEQGPDEKIKNEVFKEGIFKELIGFLEPEFYKIPKLLNEVIWILINLSCVSDEEKLKMLFKEKLINKLIKLIKFEENSSLGDDVKFVFCFLNHYLYLNLKILWCLCNIIQISEEAKHDIVNEGILEMSLRIMKSVSKDFIDFVKLKNFSILYFQCTQAKPPIKYENVKKNLFKYLNFLCLD